ncbi:MAG: lytic transglycosylase domain-containing protein [Deltaproteobacteria bacterium]|nr:lytic transglycosylase domain-containing protein [Deltaproteobacteria bacterium]
MKRLLLLHVRAVLFGFLLLPSLAVADVYMYRDKDGVINFTNVPNHRGYQRVSRDGGATPAPMSSSGDYDEAIRSASDRHSIDADLVRAVIKAESGFNSNARSSKGAMGLMQLMPDTARLHNVINAYNPADNIEGGVRHLRMLLERYQGDLRLSLAAYNAGSGAVEKFGGIPPYAETREYVRRVLRFYEGFRGGRS